MFTEEHLGAGDTANSVELNPLGCEDMRLDYQLKLEQNQRLIITPELKLAITLLQYSTVELIDYLQEELLNNPVLEVADGEEKEGEELPADASAQEEEFPWEDYFRDVDLDAAVKSSGSSSGGQEIQLSVENCTCGPGTMTEDLLGQLRMMRLSPRQYSIAAYLVGNLDSNGYLRGDLDELSRALGISVEEMEVVLDIVQDLEPTGIAARNFQECLMLQLMSLDNPPPLAVEIVSNYLPAAADCRHRHIAAKLGCDIGQVREAIDFIRNTLNPKPGSIFGDGVETRYIIPDIIVEKVEDDYVVIVNENSTPQLMISPFYYKLMQSGSKDEQLSSFVKNKFEKAFWLIRSIEQRRLTLFKVSHEIVNIQKPFLDQGIKQLKPLNLKDVAEKIGVHESTVSRATNNKYIQTPRGLFHLKFFFSSGLSGEGGEDFSSHSIKTYLRELIDQEERQDPLSDQQMMEILQERGIIISRRTVAKYREELSIPASYKRRNA